ncbi:energy-coupling factor transporter transmembrane component T family protein [Tomitella fengzijianii]|uniref:Energy-coupling factor transporter transmembrane protein EcfT n=1 Tax=Tomitella fengzijianii TaxID=2597660 RepID=A0A516X3K0_9ACTN|nr:energy-coupling factor transporter transmembrane protein EcfT [Tomitella fengzijianii]QDQ97646.1 energy-coupling factor transporter transmembrane protein EcfT [Tomitella fengzijianii]
MSALGVYIPGTSAMHRMPAGVKLAGLVILIVAMSVLVRRPWELVIPAAVLAFAAAVARIRPPTLLRQVRPMLWMLLVIAVFQLILTDWRRTLVVCGVLLLSVLGAALVTLTTRVTDMLDLTTRVVGPLRRFGVDPDRVGLVLAMTIRCIPLLGELVSSVSEARRARGLGFSLRAFAVPVVVGALRRADALGDALIARSLDDPAATARDGGDDAPC